MDFVLRPPDPLQQAPVLKLPTLPVPSLPPSQPAGQHFHTFKEFPE